MFMEVSFHSEMCKHIGKSLHGTATLFSFAVQKILFYLAFIVLKLSLRLGFHFSKQNGHKNNGRNTL